MGMHKEHLIEETSKIAYEEISTIANERQQMVYDALAQLCVIQGDATDQEIMDYLGKDDPNFVRPRRYELVNKLKLVTFSQKRKCGITGKLVLAWKIIIFNDNNRYLRICRKPSAKNPMGSTEVVRIKNKGWGRSYGY